MLQKIGALRTEFSIPSSKIFPEIEKYNPSSNYISYKKCCKKCGGISYRKHRSQFQNIFRDRKVEFLVQKYFLHKMLQKKRSFVQNSPFLVPIYIQRQENTSPRSKIFPIKNVAKKQGVCRTEFTVILQNFRMWGQKNTIATKEFCVTKYSIFLQKMLEKKSGSGSPTSFSTIYKIRVSEI